MENVLRVLASALFHEETRIGKIQARYLTLSLSVLFLLGAVFVGINYNRLPFITVLIAAIIIFGFFFTIYSIQESLLRGRARLRRQLYQAWQYNYMLPGASDPRADSSYAIALLWRWRKPLIVQVRSQGNLQDNYAGKLRDIAVSLQRIMRTKQPWIVDLDQYKHGVIYAYTADADSFAHKLFKTKLTILEIAQNVLDARTMPDLGFEGLTEKEGMIYFEIAMLSNFQAQYFSAAAADHAKAAFLDNFLEQDEYHVWEIVTRGNGTVAFVQVPLR